jgi:hypothetical protein
MTDVVFTKDLSSGRVHKRIRLAGRLVPYGGEQDNQDDAGEYIVIPEVDGVPLEDRCRRCFAEDHRGDAEK